MGRTNRQMVDPETRHGSCFMRSNTSLCNSSNTAGLTRTAARLLMSKNLDNLSRPCNSPERKPVYLL
jgi:hypothetical protein